MKILIATGGSGGHIFPALHVASELKNDGHTICFAGAFGTARERIQDNGYTIHELDCKGLSTESLKSVLIFSSFMLKSIFRSFRIIRQIRPDVVLGFGGYGAFPVIFTAALLRYPTMIHEQNVLPGRANAILKYMVKRIAISFKKSTGHFNPKRTVLTGCPCCKVPERFDKEQVLTEFGLNENKFTILVLGGSQGSRRINSVFLETLPSLKGSLDFQVIHVAGEKDYKELDKSYRQGNIPYRLFSFLEEIDKAYGVADLVITRAGAVTITEIAAFSLPAILIPYPYAGGHQKENASLLVETQISRMIEERDLSPENLKNLILSFKQQHRNHQDIERTSEGIYYPDAARHLAHEVVGLR